MKKAAIFILLSTALVTACGKSGSSMEGHSSHNETAGVAHDHHTYAEKEGEIEAKFTLSSENPRPNQDTTLTIQIQDKNGKPIEKFDTVHEKQLHLIVVSKDLSFFNHIHPEYKGNGQFTITTTFPTAGEFKAIADFTPTGMGTMNKSHWFTVQGNATASKAIDPDETFTKVVDGKEVTLTFDQLTANKELNMNFNIKDAQTKQDVTDLQPFLGAVGHVVILSQDAENYLHVHPIDEKAKGPDAKFMTTFPHSGVYKIWGQFQQNGKVFTVPFVVKVR
ncbi:hypothetical protein DNHGIG_32950 [Collibacillus ludicampi]|uniref:Secreted protein n=1 Tax=Collibacillus ludicampi TaxID=2771369 RepID=A0AAV4LJ14_9BACL|nr:hypothetical protein [Collibacillus ludicampi]GIM47746.1 hypothetical protein DNHGIG_32950 [Collibacillus ludicampi]